MKFASGTPLTEYERNECERARTEILVKDLKRRRSVISRRFYDRKPTEAQKRFQARLMGESTADD